MTRASAQWPRALKGDNVADEDLLDLRRQVGALRWFHSIDFGNGLISPGGISRSKIEQCSTIVFGRVNVTGKNVLDIGCYDGAYSIEAVKRGASRVRATDHWVWHHPPTRVSVLISRASISRRRSRSWTSTLRTFQ